METIFYPPSGGYFATHFPSGEPGRTVILFGREPGQGFFVTTPPGVDWAGEPWSYYQQTYPEIVGDTSQPSREEVESWEPEPEEQSEPGVVTDVERMASLFSQAQAGAPAYLNQLKGTVWVALVAGGMSEADATAAGVALVLRHAAPLAAFEAAGGHPVAAAALYDAIASAESVKGLPWLTAPILAIFQAALKPG